MAKGMEKLQALLTGNGRGLVNVKFFPSPGCGLTEDQFAEAACDLLSGDLNGFVDNPPRSGVAKSSL